MRCAVLLLCAPLLATVAASVQVPHSGLQHRQNAIDFDDSESRATDFLGKSGRMHDYGINVRGRPENTPGGNSATNRVQEPLLTTKELVYNGGKDFPRQGSSSDESTGNDDDFDEESKEVRRDLFPTQIGSTTLPGSVYKTAFEDDSAALWWTKDKISVVKPRIHDYDNNGAADASSEPNVRRTAGAEEAQRESGNSVDKDEHADGDGDGGQLLGENSPTQEMDSPTGGNVGRVRRGFISVPDMKTIPEVLDMGRSRCRQPPHRLERGRVLCRPVW